MKKRLIIVFSSIALVIGASYYITGKVIQKNYYEAVTKFNNQPNLKLTVVNYNRGIIHSKADLQLELTNAANDQDRQLIPLKQVITHGPVVAANTAQGFALKIVAGQIKTVLGEPWQGKLQEFTHNKNPLTITTLIDFSKQANTWVKVPGFEHTGADQVQVAMAALNGEILHDLSFSKYHGTINIPEYSKQTADWQFKVADVALKLDTNQNDGNFNNSNELNTKEITFRRNDQDIIRLNDVNAKLDFFNQDDKLTLDLVANLQKSQILQQQFTQDQFKLQANNLHRDTLKNITKLGPLSPKSVIDFVQQLTQDSTNFTFELPKYFSESLIAYLSYELYRSSPLGKFDNRNDQAILQAISGSINKLVQSAVKQKLFLDQGTYYALNFNQRVDAPMQVTPEANQG